MRIIQSHPVMDLVVAAAGSQAGESISGVHPHLGFADDAVFAATDPTVLGELDIVFVALPHGQSACLTELLPKSVKVVDLGADHRLQNPELWRRYYGSGSTDSAAMAEPWTYGLPELPQRRLAVAESTHVASPGCYATAIELALAPLLKVGLVESTDVVVVAASGTSGAGRNASTSLAASEVMGSMSAYKVGGLHQHTAEVEQELSAVSGNQVQVSFTPLLAPMPRGIVATCTARLSATGSERNVREALADAYEQEPFVQLLPVDRWPTSGATLGSNTAQLQVAVDGHAGRVVVVSALDNLGKGAAGQAVQNANLMCGFGETLGLSTTGIAP